MLIWDRGPRIGNKHFELWIRKSIWIVCGFGWFLNIQRWPRLKGYNTPKPHLFGWHIAQRERL